MIIYGKGFLPLIRELQYTHPNVTQPWYADDAGAGGKLGHILEHFQDQQARGPPRGCVARAEEFFCGMGVNIVTGSRYFGVFVGDRAAEDIWIAKKVQGWTESVKTLGCGAPASTRIPLTQDCKIHSNRSGNLCSGSPTASETTSSRWNRRCGKPSYLTSSRAWEREHQGEESHAY